MKNSKSFLLVLLGILAAFGPFVTDMYLPGLPTMTDYFNTTASMVQLGITTAMLGLGVGQLLVGPLSDKYGRKLPLMYSLWLFIFSTVACIFLEYRGIYLFPFFTRDSRCRRNSNFPFSCYRLLRRERVS